MVTLAHTDTPFWLEKASTSLFFWLFLANIGYHYQILPVEVLLIQHKVISMSSVLFQLLFHILHRFRLISDVYSSKVAIETISEI